jgi:hypothetical protein
MQIDGGSFASWRPEKMVTPPFGHTLRQETAMTLTGVASGADRARFLNHFFSFLSASGPPLFFSLRWHLRQAKIASPFHGVG